MLTLSIFVQTKEDFMRLGGRGGWRREALSPFAGGADPGLLPPCTRTSIVEWLRVTQLWGWRAAKAGPGEVLMVVQLCSVDLL